MGPEGIIKVNSRITTFQQTLTQSAMTSSLPPTRMAIFFTV